MKCKCGFKFSGPGEFRNCNAFVTNKNQSGIICPKCGKKYIGGEEVTFN
jgi:Zn finger protein HypA/HybF involved in hydrogenase expression